MKLDKQEMAKVDSPSLKGYTRRVWTWAGIFEGVPKNLVASMDFLVPHPKLAFAIFQKRGNPHDILGELYIDFCIGKYMRFDPNWLANFVKGTKYARYLVEQDGRAFLSGWVGKKGTHKFSNRASDIFVADKSAIGEFIKECGNELCTAYVWSDKCKTFEDAKRVNELFNAVVAFKDANIDRDVEGRLAKLQENVKECHEDIERVDKQRLEFYDQVQKWRETLRKFGVEVS